MSIEFKNSRWGRNRNSRLFKKTRRAAIKKIDASHLPMRVQTDKNGYWSQTSNYPVHIPYDKIHKFLKARIGKPIDKIFSEFIAEARKYKQSDNIKNAFYSCIDYKRDKYRGYSKGFYVSNGIMNYRDDYKNSKEYIPKKFIKYNEKHWDDSVFNIFKPLNNTGPNLIGKFWVYINGQYILLPVYAVFYDKWKYSRGECDDYSIELFTKKRTKNCGYLKDFNRCTILGKGMYFTVYKPYLNCDGTSLIKPCYFLYIVRISDIEKYKKEVFKK